MVGKGSGSQQRVLNIVSAPGVEGGHMSPDVLGFRRALWGLSSDTRWARRGLD